MIGWTILTLIAVLIGSALTVPLVRRYDARKGRAPNGRGVQRPARALTWLTLGGFAIGLSAIALYAAIKASVPEGGQSLSGLAQVPGADHPAGDVAGMIAGLESRLKSAPADSEGWWMLGWSYMRTGRPADAASAYGRAASLKPENADYLSAQAEALVQAANGNVSPEAAALFRRVVAVAPGDPRARFYLAMVKDQSGDSKGAVDDWVALLKSAPAGAPWAPEIRGFLERHAQERGLDPSGRLPAFAAASQGSESSQAATGPEPAQQAMIRGMVDSLARRLKSQPRDADGWVRLMRSRMVLGDTVEAASAYREARGAFADMPSEQDALREAARGLGVPGV